MPEIKSKTAKDIFNRELLIGDIVLASTDYASYTRMVIGIVKGFWGNSNLSIVVPEQDGGSVLISNRRPYLNRCIKLTEDWQLNANVSNKFDNLSEALIKERAIILDKAE